MCCIQSESVITRMKITRYLHFKIHQHGTCGHCMRKNSALNHRETQQRRKIISLFCPEKLSTPSVSPAPEKHYFSVSTQLRPVPSGTINLCNFTSHTALQKNPGETRNLFQAHFLLPLQSFVSLVSSIDAKSLQYFRLARHPRTNWSDVYAQPRLSGCGLCFDCGSGTQPAIWGHSTQLDAAAPL